MRKDSTNERPYGQADAVVELEEEEPQPGRFAGLVLQWLELASKDGEAQEQIFFDARRCSQEQIKTDIRYLTETAHEMACRFADAEIHGILFALEVIVKQLPNALAPRELLEPILRIVAFHSGDIDLLLECLRPPPVNSVQKCRIGDRSDNKTAQVDDTVSTEQSLIEYLRALRALRPALHKAVGEMRTRILELMLTPTPYVLGKLRCVENNPWLLEKSTDELLAQLISATPAVLHDGLQSLRASLEKDSGRDPAIASARLRGKNVLECLRMIGRQKVVDYPEHDLDALFEALDAVDISPFVEDAQLMQGELTLAETTTLEDAALLWLLWRVHQSEHIPEAERVPVAQAIAHRMVRWTTHSIVAHRVMAMINLVLMDANSIYLHSQAQVAELHLDAAHILYKRYNTSHDIALIEEIRYHSNYAFKMSQCLMEFDLMANAMDLYIIAIEQLPGQNFGWENAIKELQAVLEQEHVYGKMCTARARFRLAEMFMNKAKAHNAPPPDSARVLLEQAIQTLEMEHTVPETLSRLWLQLAYFHRGARIAGNPTALQEELRAFERALSLQTDQFTSDAIGSIGNGYVHALELAGAPPHQCLRHTEWTLFRMKPGCDVANRAMLLIYRAEYKSQVGALAQPISDWYGPALQYLHDARVTFTVQHNLEYLGQLLLTELRVHSRAHRLDEAISTYCEQMPKLMLEQFPRLHCELQCTAVRLYLQRNQGRDFHRAKQLLSGALELATQSETLIRLAEQACDLMWHSACAEHLLKTSPLDEQLVQIFDRLPLDTREALQLALDLLRYRRTGVPAPQDIERCLLSRLDCCPEEVKVNILAETFYFLMASRMNLPKLTQKVASELEMRLLQVSPINATHDYIACLADVARHRFDTKELTLRHVKASERLLDHADRLRSCRPNLPERTTQALIQARLEVRLHSLGLTPGQSNEALLLEAGKLLSDSAGQPAMRRHSLASRICYYLANYRVFNPTSVLAKIEEIQCTLAKEGIKLVLPPELHLKLQERMAYLPPLEVSSGLASTLLGNARRLLQENNQQLPETYQKVHDMLEQAKKLLKPAHVQDQLSHAEISAELELLWHELGVEPGHQPRGIKIAQTALTHPQIESFPVQKALLLRILANLISSESYVLDRSSIEPYQKSVALLEQAWRCDLTGEPLAQFIILINLGNAHRWLFQCQAQPDFDLIKRAVQEYRQAIELATTTEAIGPLNTATGQKCLAEALRLIGDPESQAEARILARESLELRRRYAQFLRASESSLLVAELEFDRAEMGHVEALESARDAVLDGLGFIRPETSSIVYEQLTRLRVRIERRLGAPRPIDAEGPANTSFAVHRHRHRASGQSSPDSNAHRLPYECELIAAREAILRGDLADSALAAAGAWLLRSFSGIVSKYAGELKNFDVVAEANDIELVLDKREFVNAGERLVCLLVVVMGPYGISPDRLRIIGLLKRLLRPDRISRFTWDKACLLLLHASTFCISLLHHTSDEEGELAIHWSSQALELCELHAPDDHCVTEFLNCQGLALFHAPSPNQLVQWKHAQQVLERALSLSRQRQNEHQEASVLLNLGAVLSALAGQDESMRPDILPVYERAIEICRRRGDKYSLARLLSGMGYVMSENQCHCSAQAADRAVAHLEEAREILKQLGAADALYGSVLNHLGIAYSRLHYYDKNPATQRRSRAFYEEAAGLFRALGDSIEEARVYHNLGVSMMDDTSHELRKCGVLFLFKALHVRQMRVSEAWETLTMLWSAIEQQFFPDLPAHLVDFVINCQESVRQKLENFGDNLKALNVERDLFRFFAHCATLAHPSDSNALQAHGDEVVARAERIWMRCTTMDAQLESATWLGDICSIRAWLAARGGTPALQVLNYSDRGRARTLMLHRTARQKVFDLVAQNQMLELEDALREADDNDDVSRYSVRLRLREKLRNALSDAAFADNNGNTVASSQVLHSALEARLLAEPATALINISTSDLGTIVTVACLDTTRKLQVETRILDLKTLDIRSWLKRASDADPPGWIDSLDCLGSVSTGDMLKWMTAAEMCTVSIENILIKLFRELIKPATEGLIEHGVQHLVISVAGPLKLLPIGAAKHDESAGTSRYLIEDFQSIRFIPSIETFIQKTAERSPCAPHVLLMATNTFEDSRNMNTDSRLTSHLEILATSWRSVGSRLEFLGTVFPGAPRATAEALNRALERVNVAHILCHGDFDSRNRNHTGLRLEDGLLSSQMLFQRPFPLRAKLVVVSACQSSRTEESDLAGELPGVAGMLLRSGIDTVVGALWNVSYLASTRLLEQFHAELVSGRTVPIALGHAMRYALNEARCLQYDSDLRTASQHPSLAQLGDDERLRMTRLLASPLFWAGFEVIGVA